MSSERYDVAIIGGGIAGLSLAWALVERGLERVVVLERESAVARHASGRSARTLLEIDPNPVVERLKALGGAWFRDPPAGLFGHPPLSERGALRLFAADELTRELARTAERRRLGIDLEILAPHETVRLCPALDASAFAGGIYLPRDGFLDVGEVLHGFEHATRRGGAAVRVGARVVGARWSAGGACLLETNAGAVRADVVVNAAGAWADEIAVLLGCAPLGLVALRRSLAVCTLEREAGTSGWPLVWSDAHRVYFRPFGGALLVCPMDEEPCEPCDPAVDPTVICAGLERLGRVAPGLGAPTPSRAWAGLRTFAPDGIPVAGFDPARKRVFWLAGQGGCGIETAPILAEFAADLIARGETAVFDPGILAPKRLRS